jgi:site-specific DNA recombinase
MEPAKASSRRCAIYTRKSSEEGLEQDFNSLQAQREASEAFIKSQAGEGWRLVKTAYDDGGLSGGTMERPALQRVLGDINQGLIDVVAVYKVDRLTRALADFAKMVEVFDAHGVSFVAVTQQFNTTTSMGRLTLNVLLSFAQRDCAPSAITIQVGPWSLALSQPRTSRSTPALTRRAAADGLRSR